MSVMVPGLRQDGRGYSEESCDGYKWLIMTKQGVYCCGSRVDLDLVVGCWLLNGDCCWILHHN